MVNPRPVPPRVGWWIRLLGEGLEQSPLLVRGESETLIFDLQTQQQTRPLVLRRPGADANPPPIGEIEGFTQVVQQDLLEAHGLPHSPAGRSGSSSRTSVSPRDRESVGWVA